MTGNRVTHVVIGINEYERLVKRSMELDAVAQIEREKVGDDSAEWIDHRDFAAQLAGDAIAKARKGQGMTQKQLADKLDMPQSQISRIERNPDRTTIRTIKKIAKALGVDVRALISTMGR
jgi:ribosome-binding protein aMBF1 (putative translation factor)